MLNGKFYALKEIPIFKITSIKEIYAYLNEPYILKRLINYNFLPKIISSFQDYNNFYLVTNLFEGNNLDCAKDNIFSEEQIKFISACMIQSLSYLRKEKIISRDVTMNNLIMDNERYLNLIDFSFSISHKDKKDKNSFLLISPIDSSPETNDIKKSPYDYNSDYYRIGVIIYYLIFKRNINVIKNESNVTELKIDSNNIKNYSSSCIDFLNKLIINNFRKRIGFKSINELKNHHWFKDFDWKNFEKKKMNSPLNFIPKKASSKCEFILTEKNNYTFTFNKILGKYNFVNKEIIRNILKYSKI